MGGKKKVEVQPAPAPVAVEKPTNTILKIITSDQKEFKISEDLFSRYSFKIKSLSQNTKDNTIRLDNVDNESMQYIVKYLEMHKDN